jgi:DNA-cytosine methyltransferase
VQNQKVMKKKIKVGSDFSGVGAFDYAIQRVAEAKGLEIETVYACDWDKYARISYVAAHGEPPYYPKDVYEREVPEESLDIYMTSPPCQAFSLAGKRLGKDDSKGRGILFFNSLEFIEKNQPRYFIFENVKGLLSDDNGRTFQEWINLLGGKSVNGVPVLFPYEGSVNYHLYWQVLNTKEHGVPQNRERVFIIGIRDDKDNNFRFPKTEHLTKRLKDILEEEVFERYYLSEERISYILRHDANKNILIDDVPNESRTCIAGYYKSPRDCQYIKVKSNLEKYYLSDKMIDYFESHKKEQIQKGNGFKFQPHTENTDVSNTISTKCGSRNTDPYIKIESLKCDCANCQNQEPIVGTWRTHEDGRGFRATEDNNCPTIPARAREDGSGQPVVMQINPSTESNGVQPFQQNRVYDADGISPALNAEQTWGGNAVLYKDERSNDGEQWIQGGLQKNQPKQFDGVSPCLTSAMGMGGGQTPIHNYQYRVRRLTPLECFRLQDFPDEHTAKCREAGVSDSQLYKQAGNSITVRVLQKILTNMNL